MQFTSNTPTSSMTSKVVIRGGHVIPSIRLTPPDSRPEMSIEVPEQDLGPNSLFVPLRTEEIGWEEGGLIWAAKRYFYPTVNLYGGSDDHIIGSYRGGPKGYRYVKITDEAFALANTDEDEVRSQESKTSNNGSKSALPKGPATRVQQQEVQKPTESVSIQPSSSVARRRVSSSSSESTSSSPCSSRRGSSSTEDDDDSSGADTGMTTPTTSDSPYSERKHSRGGDMAEELKAALSELSHENVQIDSKRTKLASRMGEIEISNEPVDASRLAGPLKTQLYNNSLGLDRSLTLSDSVPDEHFQKARGRSRSRRTLEDEYSAGWSYEDNMRQEAFEGDLSLES